MEAALTAERAMGGEGAPLAPKAPRHSQRALLMGAVKRKAPPSDAGEHKRQSDYNFFFFNMNWNNFFCVKNLFRVTDEFLSQVTEWIILFFFQFEFKKKICEKNSSECLVNFYHKRQNERNFCLNLVWLNQICILITLFRLIWHLSIARKSYVHI